MIIIETIAIVFLVVGIIYWVVVWLVEAYKNELRKEYYRGFGAAEKHYKDFAYDKVKLSDLQNRKPLKIKELEDELIQECEDWVLNERFKSQREMNQRQAKAEQFCDDLQRMLRLEEDSEEFLRGFKRVK